MGLTTDPNHPDVKRYTGPEEPGPQNKVYLVLSEEERAKGFIRPVRQVYTHVGLKPKYKVEPLSQEDLEEFKDEGWIAYEKYPEDGNTVGRYWSQEDLDNKGCGGSTTMGLVLSETYARQPGFYGATYCVHCMKHLPVEEFIWDDGEVVGS